jgi:hypothetical protein
MTEAEYLDFERASASKHEYLAGAIVAMTGASEQHNLIATNVTIRNMPDYFPRSRGSSQSRSPSPNRLNPATTSSIATAGQVASHHWVAM